MAELFHNFTLQRLLERLAWFHSTARKKKALGRFHKRDGVGPSVDKGVGVPRRKCQRCDLQIQS
jgi:hypothetical protein